MEAAGPDAHNLIIPQSPVLVFTDGDYLSEWESENQEVEIIGGHRRRWLTQIIIVYITYGILQAKCQSELPLPTPGDLPNQEIEPTSLSLAGRFFTTGNNWEKEMATHSSILAWRIPWTEEPRGLLSMGSHSWTWLKRLSMHVCIGEGNGNPLQCSCLENPRDGGAWWAAVYGVAQSQTQLKRLSSSSTNWEAPLTLYFIVIYTTYWACQCF